MKTISKFFIAFFLLTLFSCDDIMEKDITNDMVITVSPSEGQEIYSNVVNFRWNELKGANSYRLQVYSEGAVVMDSLVKTNNFTQTLQPGDYQWRVRGENFAYQTAYTFPKGFKLIETDDLTNQQVLLLNPLADAYSNTSVLSFNWTELSAATSYEFQIINTATGGSIVQENDLSTNSYSVTSGIISQDGQYSWKVKAKNSDNDTQTGYSTRSFYIDTTPPNAPQNSSPSTDATVSLRNEVNFQWSGGTDTGVVNSAVTYTLQIATDTGFTNVIQTVNTANLSYGYTFSVAGTYYWRVRSKDQANNSGAYSTYSKLTVQ
ncbi:hypothetical protein ACLI08_16180 [Flavobacterium sp. RNTU_13]|uniref:hypothetical protein n=1 Tax=Flavobacterium sp. RNTU_13 TaxID=3375145 RepID=UPI003987DF67